jgi:antitoxin PrlF
MATATITSKGQITIPKAIRDSLHLRSGDRVEFLVHGETEALLRPCIKSVDEVFGRLHKAGRAKRSVDDMQDAVVARMRRQGG